MKSILIVEDDKLLGSVLKARFEKEHYHVILAENADEGLAALDENNIILIYLDLNMPGDKDGFDFLKIVKSKDQYRNIPILVLSNFSEMSHMDKATELGASDYLLKVTVNLNKLVELTQDHLLKVKH